MTYPKTRRVDIVEDHFGHSIADPYRWLEADARKDAEVKAWVEAQAEFAQEHLSKLPGREIFRQRLTALLDHDRLTAPYKRGNRYFFTRHAGLANQPVLVMREGPDGEDRMLIDPNGWSQDGADALAEWAPSADGARLAYATQDGGTDWRTIRVLEIDSGAILDDSVSQVRFSQIDWAVDGSGFFYSRFPGREEAGAFDAPVSGHAIYFHRLGTPQTKDRLVHATPDMPHLVNVIDVTEDGRYAAITSTPGAGGNALSVIDLTSEDWTPRVLVERLDHSWSMVGNVGSLLFLTTDEGGERGRVLAVDLDRPDTRFEEIVPEDEAVLNAAALIGGELITTYMKDAKSQVRRFALDGTPLGTIELPGIGTAGGFRGAMDDDEAFFVFTSSDAPTTIYRYDVSSGARTVWAKPDVPVDLDEIVLEQRFYASKDGTRVPIFILRRGDVTGPAPTILYGYGGFGISMVPYYAPHQIAWVEQGGVFAVANIRGGSEYGKAWHDGGRLKNRKNAFDDFIAAGEFLIAEGITPADGLAIQGESNGGLLVGAVTNQRPDLFAAAIPGVGVMDMLRFNRFTGGMLWMGDFGDPAKKEDFETILAYSPYHTIAEGRAYPAVLATTADTDDRVVPAHSFKYVAALQAADLGEKPRLLRVDVRSGHGAGKPLDKSIEEIADMWAFAAYWTGLKVAPRAD
ncbi:prolyl oligopeptidase family serine peptidase [Aureimonas mangrovi]|uniref:prolyl oligopeptidase family serine peptidase n=1 Tax=Aureimonas mangrovi TaxID=2758041 RepID=UPI00163D867E|nr:prolyl oligopeptidase family serine peptidase [Aureimonas mangrovi]